MFKVRQLRLGLYVDFSHSHTELKTSFRFLLSSGQILPTFKSKLRKSLNTNFPKEKEKEGNRKYRCIRKSCIPMLCWYMTGWKQLKLTVWRLHGKCEESAKLGSDSFVSQCPSLETPILRDDSTLVFFPVHKTKCSCTFYSDWSAQKT